MTFTATWMNLEIFVLGAVSQKEIRKRYIIYLQNLKYDKNELISETETDSQITENKLVVTKGESRE